MGLSENEFLDMTPRQFYAMRQGQIEREKREAERIRLAAYLIATPTTNKGKTIMPLRRWWPLPWDNETAPVFEEQTPEERAAFAEKAKRIIEQKRLKRGNNSGS